MRLLCFDNTSNNFGDDFSMKNVEDFIVNSFSSLNNTLIIDKDNFKAPLRRLEVYRTIDLDSNIISYLRRYLKNGQTDDNFKTLLLFLKSNDLQLNCLPYMLETGANKHNIKRQDIYESILSFCAFDTAKSLSEFQSLTFENVSKNENIITKAEKITLDIIEKISDSNIQIYDVIYSILLKTYIIKFKSKNSAKNKLLELINSINNEIYVYSENELYISYLFFKNDNSVKKFLDSIKPNSKNVLNKIRGMAWDLYHLKNLEKQVQHRNKTDFDKLYLHYFCSRDFGINDILKLNPIKRMLITDSQPYPIREKNIFDLEFGNKLFDELNKYKQHRIINQKNSDLKLIINTFEKQLLKLID